MADLQTTARVVFETEAQLAGAEAAAESMDREIGRAKALGKEYEELETRHKELTAAIAESKSRLTESTTATTKLADESERYQQVLQQMEKSVRSSANSQRITELREEASARQEAANELERYNATLARMAAAEGGDAGQDNSGRTARIEQLKAEALARRTLAEKMAENGNATKTLREENISLAQFNEDSLNPAVADYTKNLAEAGDEAERNAVKHRELNRLFHEADQLLPGLGSAFKSAFATTPLAAAVAALAAVIGGFAIYKMRVDELVKSLGGLELPDLSPPDPTKVDTYTKALHAMNEAIRDAKEHYDSAGAASDRYLAKLKVETEQQKKLLEGRKALELAALEQNKGVMSADQYVATKAAIDSRYAAAGVGADDRTQQENLAEQYRRAMNLDIEAARKRREAAAIHVNDNDSVNLDDLKKQAAAAQDEQKDAKRRNLDISSFEDAPWYKGGFLLAKMISRYGFTQVGGMHDMEDDRINRAQGVIDRYNNEQKAQEERNRLRQRRTDLEQQANAAAAEAEKTRLGLPDATKDLSRDKNFRQQTQTQTDAAAIIGTELGQKILQAAQIADEFFDKRKPGEIKQLPPEQERLILDLFNQLTGRNVRPGELPPAQVGGAAGVFRDANNDPAKLLGLYNQISAANMLGSAAAGADLVRMGGTVSDQMKTTIIKMAELLTNQTQTFDQAVKIISSCNDKIATFNAVVQQLDQRMDQLTAQFNSRISKGGP